MGGNGKRVASAWEERTLVKALRSRKRLARTKNTKFQVGPVKYSLTSTYFDCIQNPNIFPYNPSPTAKLFMIAEFFGYDSYSYFDVEKDMAKQRVPQPKSGATEFW